MLPLLRACKEMTSDKLKMTYIDEEDNDTETIYFHRR